MYRVLLVAALLLLLVGPAAAAIYTIGNNGAYPTLAAAVADASINMGNHEFRLQTGSHTSNIAVSLTGEKIWIISGGWNPTFDISPIAADATQWQAEPTGGTALTVDLRDRAQLFVRNLSLSDGSHDLLAGAIEGNVFDQAIIGVQDCRITANKSKGSSAGIHLVANQNSIIQLSNCEVTDNVVLNGGAKAGIGAYLRAHQNARVMVFRVRFAGNHDTSMSAATLGTGLYLELHDVAFGEIYHTMIESNAAAANTVEGAGVYALLVDDSRLHSDGLRLSGNSAATATLGTRTQGQFRLHGTSGVRLSNCLVVNSALGGLDIDHQGTGIGIISHCTIANHQLVGLDYVAATGVHIVSNTIVHNNRGTAIGAIIDPVVLQSANLGDDLFSSSQLNPMFQDANTDFRLQDQSPAIDAGNNAYVYTSLDLDGNPRLAHGLADIGAYENQAPLPETLFNSGFEDSP